MPHFIVVQTITRTGWFDTFDGEGCIIVAEVAPEAEAEAAAAQRVVVLLVAVFGRMTGISLSVVSCFLIF